MLAFKCVTIRCPIRLQPGVALEVLAVSLQDHPQQPVSELAAAAGFQEVALIEAAMLEWPPDQPESIITRDPELVRELPIFRPAVALHPLY